MLRQDVCRTMKWRLLANLNWLFADKVLRLIGGLLVGVWVARYLGPERFGELNYALAFVAMFAAVARLGMDQVVIRELIQRPEQEGEILGSVFVLKLLASLAALAVVVPVAWVAQSGDIRFVVLVSVIAAGMLCNAFDAYDLYYQARVLSKYVVCARSASFVVFSALRIFFIVGEYPLVSFALAATLEITLAAALLVWMHLRQHRGMGTKWCCRAKTMLALLKDGWPLTLSSALVVVHTRIDQVMIGQLLGNHDVGVYSAAVRLSESWLFLPLLIVQTVTPYLMQVRDTNSRLYEARLLQLYSLMFWLGVCAAVATILFGEHLVILLFGEAYKVASLPLVLTVWTGIFISQAVARGVWLVGENMQGFRLFINVMAVPMNLALNWLLIPRLGVVGASMASLISIGVSTWALPFLFAPMRVSNRQMLISIHPKYLFSGVR